MTNVQIAIADRGYAEQVAQLLADGEHRVYIVETPTAAIDGVIVVDEPHLRTPALDAKDADRYIVMSDGPFDTVRLWRAGIRYLAFTSDPPSVTQIAVLAAELRLMHHRGQWPELYWPAK